MELEPIDIHRIQTFYSGNHTNLKIYYEYEDKNNPSCKYTDVTNNNKTSLFAFQVVIPEPIVMIETCSTNCTTIEVTVDYTEFKNVLDVLDYTEYADYYDNGMIQIILQDPLSGEPVALDLDGNTGGTNTTTVDMSGPNNNLTYQTFCIDLAPYYKNQDGSINPQLYGEHTYQVNLLEPKEPTDQDPSTTMVVASIEKKFDLPDPLSIDATTFTAFATADNKIEVTYKVLTNNYNETELGGEIVITNEATNIVMDTITLTSEEIKASATTPGKKTSNVTYEDDTKYNVTLNVYAKDSSGNKINCSTATATQYVTMQITPSLIVSECTSNCTSVILTPTIDKSFYPEGSVMRIYLNDGENQRELDLDPTSIKSYYLVSEYDQAKPFIIDLTTVFPTINGSIDPKVYQSYTYTLKIFDSPTNTEVPLKTVTSEPYAIMQPPTITSLNANAEYNNHITINYIVDANSYDNLTGEIKIYSSDEKILYETITLSESDIDDEVTKTSALKYAPGVEYKIVLDVFEKDEAGNIISCSHTSTMTIVTMKSEPKVIPYQTCDDGCDVTFNFAYDGTMYPVGSKIYLSVYDKNKDELYKDIEIGATQEGATSVDTLTYTLENDTILYENHYYTFRIDVPGIEDDPTISTEFELKEPPNVESFTMEYIDEVINFNYVIDLNDYSETKAHIELYKDESTSATIIPITDSVNDGYITGTINIDNLEPGVYSSKLVLEYAIGENDCKPITIDSEEIMVAYPDPTVSVYQVCDTECIVNFDLSYDGSMYPVGTPIHFITYDENGKALTNSIIGYTKVSEDAVETFKYNLDEDEYKQHAPYEIYNYTFIIDIEDVENDPKVDTSYELLEKPSITAFETSYDSGELTILYDYDTNDFDNASAYINIYKDNEFYMDITLEEHSDTIVVDNILPGNYTTELVIDYSIGNNDCTIVTETKNPIIVEYPDPTITPYQDCAKECLVDVAIEYDASMYPIDSEVVVLQDETEVLRYSISDTSHNIEGTNMYNYELTTKDYEIHDYVVYIDTMTVEENFPASETIEFALLEKPEVNFLTTTVNSDDTITITYDVDLNDCPDATGTLAMTNSNGDTKTYNIDSNSLATGSYTTNKLPEGEYQATLIVDYWGDCPTVIFESKPVEIKHKLAYTGLEFTAFESFIMNIQETITKITTSF